ncbi:MAG: hypothetical protein IKR09_04095 [Alphaproteobacteria bacterium]|nr:hypothetical protein [Alphaproteobacteria bacterium]
MTYLKKSGMFGLMAISFLFCARAAQAIPVPTIGAELAVQVDQLTKHIDELKKVKDQISNGVEQAKAMGDKMSMDALKNFAKGQAQQTLSGAMKSVDIPQEMSRAGLTEEVMKDPSKTSDVVEKLKKSGKTGEYDVDKRRVCWDARESMKKELAMLNLTNSFALQQNIASGEQMKKAQEAVGSSDDQMQLIGANTAVLRMIYQLVASSTAMKANDVASSALESMCD